MSISIKCSNCGKDYELPDSQAGKKLACVCGQIQAVPSTSTLTLPSSGASENSAPPIPPGLELPPHIGNQQPETANTNDMTNAEPESGTAESGVGAAKAAKPALSIGIKKDTGTPPVNAIEENFPEPQREKRSLVTSLLPLIKVMFILLLLGSVCAVVFYFVNKKNYGISAKNPLGTYSELNKHLMKMRLVRSKKAKPTSRSFKKKGKIITFKDDDLKTKSRGVLSEWAFLVVDSKGKVLGVGGVFHTSTVVVPGTTAHKVGRFLKHYWKEIGCKEPAFKTVGKGEFGEATNFKCAYGNNKIKVKWTKDKVGLALYEWRNVVIVVDKECSFKISRSLFNYYAE